MKSEYGFCRVANGECQSGVECVQSKPIFCESFQLIAFISQQIYRCTDRWAQVDSASENLSTTAEYTCQPIHFNGLAFPTTSNRYSIHVHWCRWINQIGVSHIFGVPSFRCCLLFSICIHCICVKHVSPLCLPLTYGWWLLNSMPTIIIWSVHNDLNSWNSKNILLYDMYESVVGFIEYANGRASGHWFVLFRVRKIHKSISYELAELCIFSSRLSFSLGFSLKIFEVLSE